MWWNMSGPNFPSDGDGEHHSVFPNDNSPGQNDDKGYAQSGKIMLSAIIILFFVVILMVCLHLYARWYLLRRRDRHRRNRRNRNHLVFHVDNNSPAANRGLDAAVLGSIPVFVFKNLAPPKGKGSDSDSYPPPIDCAVCLSEFKEGETGRKLPKCGHCFHTDCIDMWFHSHSTCPLCRSPVEPGSDPEVCIDIGEPEPGPDGETSLAGLCSECKAESSSSSSSSSSEIEARRKKKPVSVSIEVPRRTGSFGGGGDDCESAAAGQTSSFRSPISRMLSFKTRMLSSFRSPTAATASSSSVNESDLERGKEGSQ